MAIYYPFFIESELFLGKLELKHGNVELENRKVELANSKIDVLKYGVRACFALGGAFE